MEMINIHKYIYTTDYTSETQCFETIKENKQMN